ncbi:hypothetical protein [Edaphobacter modestus]|uniref:Uncharacterized protein n=1 Tax=Edaphobacter modestus TaxID=388466 RepID=A0A4Q7YVX5_9BACT|nr:hypothetical protein [Edaphobacter modestus]RZU41830.1 hypothetical protein BDD14_3367 [Edaphobacter modestus]
MQRAKDTFYIAMRDRIASLNPARTVLVRGVLRPGVLVEENELAVEYPPANAFRLRWTALSVNPGAAMPLMKMRCEIHYSTAGNPGNGGMDRGRLITVMDAELAAAVNEAPQNAAKKDYAIPSGPEAPQTNIFWSDVAFEPLQLNGEQLERVATVDVYSYQEAGER